MAETVPMSSATPTVPTSSSRQSARQKERREKQKETPHSPDFVAEPPQELLHSGEEKEPTESRVYCLCRQPDDGSYMLACDKCEEWYHGRCVKVTKKVGDRLKTYICPQCNPQDTPLDEDKYVPSQVEDEDEDDADEMEEAPLSPPYTPQTTPDKVNKKRAPPVARTKDQPQPKKQALSNAINENELQQQKDTVAKALRRALLTGGQCSEERAQELSKAIVDHLYTLFPPSSPERVSERKEKIRSLFTHIKDEKNVSLRSRIISEELSVAALCSLPEIELASNRKELCEMQQALRQEANRMVTFTDEHDTPIIRKTHKGEELVQSEDVMPDTEIVEIPPYLGASNERSDAGSTDQDTSEPHSPTEDADDSSSPSTGASAPPSSSPRSSASDGESQASPSTTPPDSPPFRRSDDNVDTGDGSDSPDRDQLRETLQARKVESGLTEFFEQSQPPTQSAASPPPDNAPRPAEKKAAVWQGFVEKCPDEIPHLGVKAVQLCGRNVGKVFGMKDLAVVGRMEMRKMLDYIEQLKMSNSCKRAALYLLPDSPGQEANYKAFYQYYFSMSRVAVINSKSFAHAIREIFIAPFSPTMSPPPFIKEKGKEVTHLWEDRREKLVCIVVYYRSNPSKASKAPSKRSKSTASSGPRTPPPASPPRGSSDELPRLPSPEVSSGSFHDSRTLEELAQPSTHVNRGTTSQFGSPPPAMHETIPYSAHPPAAHGSHAPPTSYPSPSSHAGGNQSDVVQSILKRLQNLSGSGYHPPSGMGGQPPSWSGPPSHGGYPPNTVQHTPGYPPAGQHGNHGHGHGGAGYPPHGTAAPYPPPAYHGAHAPPHGHAPYPPPRNGRDGASSHRRSGWDMR